MNKGGVNMGKRNRKHKMVEMIIRVCCLVEELNNCFFRVIDKL